MGLWGFFNSTDSVVIVSFGFEVVEKTIFS